MAEIEDCHDPLPVKVEIEEDPLGETSAIWNNWHQNEIGDVPSSFRFRCYNRVYTNRSISSVSLSSGPDELAYDGSTDEKVSKETEAESGNQDVPGKLYTCSYCMRCFKQKKYLMEHLKLHLNNIVYQCNVCQVIFPDSSAMADHRKTHSYGRRSCLVCGKISRQAARVDNSTGGSAYKCSACENRFTIRRFAEMNGQRRYYNEDRDRRLTCLLCGKKFSVVSDLTKHLRVHTGERPFLCQLCQKGFKQSSALTSHLRTHTGQRPYVCQLCFKAFTQSSALNTHKKIHMDSLVYKLNNQPVPE